MDIEQKFKDLEKYVKMESQEDVRLFDITVYELSDTKDLKVLDRLIDFFDDDCELEEVMYSLVHAIETYPKEIYVTRLLLKAVDFQKYPEWFKTLMYGILNNNSYLSILKQNIQLAQKEPLLQLLDKIYEESEMHRPIIDELKKLLNDKNK